MFGRSIESWFLAWRDHGEPEALARVFDATAGELARVARHLAGPEASAEDLLQATFLTAIESRARYDASQRVLPWLLGILANHAREARRRARRDLDAERLLREPVADPAEDAARAELESSLARAIAEQPEAYRAVLRLYLLHGLEPAEIAASLERPPGTVRAQLSRGLERLRRALPASLAGAHALAALPSLDGLRARVLAHASDVAPAASIALPTAGLFALVMWKKVLLASALILLACLPFLLRGDPESPPIVVTSEVAAASLPAIPRDATPPAATSDPAAAESRTIASDDPMAAPPKAISSPTTASLRVRVESDGRPIADAGVAVQPITKTGTSPGALLEFRRTDAHGVIVFDDLAPGSYLIEVDRWIGMDRIPLNAGDEAERVVTLQGVQVRGRVLDQNGSPVPRAEIVAHGERLVSVVVARADERGEFVVSGVTPLVALQARRSGYAPSKAPLVAGRPGEVWSVELVLEGQAGEVSGRVLTHEGEPVAKALVMFVPSEARLLRNHDEVGKQQRTAQVWTDGEGAFQCTEVPLGRVHVTAAGGSVESTPAGAELDVTSVPQRLDLRLGLGATIEGRITNGGRPMTRATVVVFTSTPDVPCSYVFNLLGWHRTTTDREGKFRVGGIAAGTVELRITKNGLDSLTQQTWPMAPGERRVFDFDCAASPGLPLEVSIEPWPALGGGGTWFVSATHLESPQGETTLQQVDSKGRARFARVPDGRLQLSVYGQPVPGDLITLAAAEIDARQGSAVLRIPPERLRVQPLRGRLVDQAGRALTGRRLQLQCRDAVAPFALQRTTGDDGAFEFANLPGGSYSLQELTESGPRHVRDLTFSGERAEDLGALVVP